MSKSATDNLRRIVAIGACGGLFFFTSARAEDAVLPPAATTFKPVPPLSNSALTPRLTDSLGDPLPTGARMRLGTVRFRPPSGVQEIAVSPDGKTVVTLGDHLIIWDAPTGKERFRSNELPIRSQAASYGCRALCFSADGQHFYTPGVLDDLMLWDLDGRSQQIPIPLAKDDPIRGQPGIIARQCRAIDVVGNGELLAQGTSRGVTVLGRDHNVLFEIANAAQGNLRDKAKVKGYAGKLNSDRMAFGGDFSFVRFSPDGKLLAVVLSQKPDELRLLEAPTGKELRRIPFEHWMVRLDFSPDSLHLVTTERDSSARLYDVESGRCSWSHIVKLDNPNENYTSAVAFSPDGKIAAVCATDELIHLLDASTGEEVGVLKGHAWYPWTLSFTADSKMLYSSGWDPAIRRWDVAARLQLPPPTGVRGTEVVTISPDGKMLAYEETGGIVHLVRAEDGSEFRTLADDGCRFSQLRFSHDSRLLAAGGSIGGDVRVVIFEAATGAVKHRFSWPKGGDPHSTIESLEFTPNGDRLAAAVFRQSAAYVWDLKTGEQFAKLAHNDVYGLSFSSEGKTLATAGWDRIVRLWEMETGVELRRLAVEDRDGNQKRDVRMYAVCYSPAGDVLATAHMDHSVRLWSVKDLSLRGTLNVGDGFTFGAMSFSPDGLWLVTGGRSGKVTLWDVLEARVLGGVGQHESYVYTVSFGNDARTIVSGGADGVGYVWDLRRFSNRDMQDLTSLWGDFLSEDSQSVFYAACDLSSHPEIAVRLLREKLRPVRFLIDERRDAPAPGVEAAQVRRLKKILVEKPDSDTIRGISARRALAILSRLGTADAQALLEELARRDPTSDLGMLATAALKVAVPVK
ncbi:MAG TPA: WD40 repeat domain-containing protein [Pirellulales bacterium]|jgi:WD40 repeat protein